MNKISIIGAGTVGATTAFLMALKNLGDVVLLDIVENLAQGKALDIMHCASLENFQHAVTGTNSYSDIGGSDVVVITGGLARTEKTTSRMDLLMTNFEIVRDIARQISRHAPDAFIIVVTNPVDVMTWVASEFSGAKKHKVVGMGGVLDSSRLNYYLSKCTGIHSEKFSSMVIGNHGEHMVCVKHAIHLGTKSAANLRPDGILSDEQVHSAIEQTRNAGQTILKLTKMSTCYAPASAITSMTDAYLNNKRTIMPCSLYLTGQYGARGTCTGVPVMIDRNGAEQVLTMELDDEERKVFDAAVVQTQASIDTILRKIASEDVERKQANSNK